MAAAACDADLTLLTSTKDYPSQLDCADLGSHVRTNEDAPGPDWTAWSDVAALPGGDVHVSAIPVMEAGLPVGFVVLVHDLSFVQRREATTRRFLLLAFGVLALTAAVVTLVTARLSWRGWSDELRGFLRSGGATARVPADPPGRARSGRPYRRRERVRSRRRALDSATVEAHSEPDTFTVRRWSSSPIESPMCTSGPRKAT